MVSSTILWTVRLGLTECMYPFSALTSKSAYQTSLTMERTCKLYDGDYWYTVKGKGKRAGVQSARMSMSTFATPRRFLTDIWPKVVSCRNGLANRILVLCQERMQRDMEEIELFSTQLVQESAVGRAWELYMNRYTLNTIKRTSSSTRELYYKYCKGKKQKSSQLAAGTFSPECNAKSNKNAIRLALNMHILWHRLDMAL